MAGEPKPTDRGEDLYGSYTREPTGGVQPGSRAPDPHGAGGSGVASASPAPFMSCSDCRAAIRTNYYALNERPICAKCKPKYAAAVARGTGPKAMWRAMGYGLGAATAGAALLTAIILTLGFFRILTAIAIGWMVGTAVRKATGDLSGRRYQWLAVGLTYFAVGVGSLVPVIRESMRPPTASETLTARQDAEQQAEIARILDSGDRDPGDAGTDAADSEATVAGEQTDVASPHAEQAARLRGSGFFGVLAGGLLLILTLPLLSMFAYGLHGAAVGFFSIGYGIKKAWDLTDAQGLELKISGPYRVGSGPIAAG